MAQEIGGNIAIDSRRMISIHPRIERSGGVLCFRIKPILAPAHWVGVDIRRDGAVIVLAADDVVVIGALPEGAGTAYSMPLARGQ